jgi:hypothetical protein
LRSISSYTFFRHDDAAGLGYLFQPCSDVDPITVEIAALNHHVPEIDANAQDDPSALLGTFVGDRHSLLESHGAAYRLDSTGELD